MVAIYDLAVSLSCMSNSGKQQSSVFVNSKRFYISHWSELDFYAFSLLVRDPKVMRYIGRGEIWDPVQTKSFISRQQSNFNDLQYGLGPIKCHGNDELIGMAGLQPLANTDHVEIGCWLLPKFWGHNRAYEIGEALLKHGFNTLDLNEIWALARQHNRASIAIMKRLGFSYHATVWGGQLGLEAQDVEIRVYKKAKSLYSSINETV